MSIHAEVIPEYPLDWFTFLRNRAPASGLEIKSSRIIDLFFGLTEHDRRRVITTLKSVRIHITDPRLYTNEIDEALADIIPGREVAGFIARLDHAVRQTVETERRRMIARRMFRDSPSEQIKLKHRVFEYSTGMRINEALIPDDMLPFIRREAPKDFDFEPFERSKKNMVNVLSPTLSKSESVFADAADKMDEIVESGSQSVMLVAAQLAKILSNPHAFDIGDHQELEWIDSERDDVISQVTRGTYFGLRKPQPLVELESTNCVPLQAADFAAGIAREIWYRNSLPHLVRVFEYVKYNGKRISEADANGTEAKLRKLPSSSPASRRAAQAARIR